MLIFNVLFKMKKIQKGEGKIVRVRVRVRACVCVCVRERERECGTNIFGDPYQM